MCFLMCFILIGIIFTSTQRSKQTLGHHFQQHHPGMVSNHAASMGHMMEMMSQRHQAPPLQHHHHHHPHPHHSQLSAAPLTYPQRCHAPPQPHLGSAHQSPPARLHQGSPPAPPLSVPPQVRRWWDRRWRHFIFLHSGTFKTFCFCCFQLSPVAQQIPPPQPLHSQHAVQASGSCSGAGGGGGGGGSRRRRTVEHDPDERRQKFLERNRAAATRCRQKRKLWVSSLEKKAEELTHTNLQLQVSTPTPSSPSHPAASWDTQRVSVCVFQNEVTSLRSEVGQLKQILLTHKDCPVTARQREAQGYPSE